MRKRGEMIGLLVVHGADGRVFGHVLDLLLSKDGMFVTGLVVESNGIFAKTGEILLEDIVVMGKNAVVAKNCTWQHKRPPQGNKIRMRDASGNEIGILKDFWFNENNGRIEVLEMSRGIFDDMRMGRALVPRFAWMDVGQELMVLPSQKSDKIEEQTDGRDAQ